MPETIYGTMPELLSKSIDGEDQLYYQRSRRLLCLIPRKKRLVQTRCALLCDRLQSSVTTIYYFDFFVMARFICFFKETSSARECFNDLPDCTSFIVGPLDAESKPFNVTKYSATSFWTGCYFESAFVTPQHVCLRTCFPWLVPPKFYDYLAINRNLHLHS